jgi:L-aminopeptidase/D-esterase-like protein
MREISITDIENIRIGNAQDEVHATGCTVMICERTAPTGLAVLGGGPASRESELLRPLANADGIHAVLLSGGSAYGLDAAGGVMQYLEEKGIGFGDSQSELYRLYKPETNLFTGNTTIGAVITNGRFQKTQMNKIAAMSHNGYARTICPVNTSADGDSIYAMSVGDVSANVDMVGTLGAMVMGRAIRNAALYAGDAYGLKAGKNYWTALE